MLALSRLTDEAFLIDDDVEITVAKINRNLSARLRIDAPQFSMTLNVYKNNTFKIREQTEVKIVSVHRGIVRFAIEAPRSTNIARSELVKVP